MDSKAVPWWMGVAWGAAAALCATCVGYWWEVLAWLERFEKLAGWAQAFGGVASILFSGWFVAEQIKASREIEQESRLAEIVESRQRAMRAIDIVAENFIVTIVGTIEFIEGDDTWWKIKEFSAGNISIYEGVANGIDFSHLNKSGEILQFNLILYSRTVSSMVMNSDDNLDDRDQIVKYLRESENFIRGLKAKAQEEAA